MSATNRPVLRNLIVIVGCLLATWPAIAADESSWPKVVKVEQQPLVAATERVLQALDYVGAPISPDDRSSATRSVDTNTSFQ